MLPSWAMRKGKWAHINCSGFRLTTVSITGALEQSNTAVDAIRMKQEQLGQILQESLTTLVTNVRSERDISNQLAEAQLNISNLKIQLEVGEHTLTEARESILSLRGVEEAHKQEIADMQAAHRNQPATDPAITSRLEAVELEYGQLQHRFASLQRDLAEKCQEAQRQHEELKEKESCVKVLNIQLNQAKLGLRTLEEVKSACELEASKRYECLKSQLHKTTNAERELLGNAHAAAMESLERQKAAADDKFQQLEDFVKTVNVADDRGVLHLLTGLRPNLQALLIM